MSGGRGRTRTSDAALATVKRGVGVIERMPVPRGSVFVVCRDPEGLFKWEAEGHNLVVNVGLDSNLSVYLVAGTQITAWFVGLINGASPTLAAGDTAASHAGWTENQNYTEATREAWTPGAVSAASVDNSASKASFAINTDTQTIGGCFLISNNTKGGTTGTLYSEVVFTGGAKAADDGDTLEVTYTFTAADDGV